MKPELDLLNRQIIVCLQQDGRRTFASIASELHVAESTVRTRVNKLTESGILKFFGDIDPYPVGLTYAHVMIRVRGTHLRHAAKALAEVPEILYVGMCTGSYDIITDVICRDNQHLLKLIQDDVRPIPGIEYLETFITLDIVKDANSYEAVLLGPESG
jgi:Lrp/AsnC family transcriptional regulator for asnA, asnC and gidA